VHSQSSDDLHSTAVSPSVPNRYNTDGMRESSPLYTTILPLPATLSLSQIYTRWNLCQPHTVVLDSGAEPSPRGHLRLVRYCFLAQEPFGILEAYPHCILWRDARGTRRLHGEPLRALGRFLRRFHLPAQQDLPTPLPAGALGYLGYGLKAYVEPCPNLLPAPNGLPLYWFGFYDTIATIDLEQQQVILTSTGLPLRGAAAHRRAQQRLQYAVARWEKVLDAQTVVPEVAVRSDELYPLWARSDYLRAVQLAKRYIAQGDIYQINLSQAYQARLRANPASLFLRMREVSPAPFSAFLNIGRFSVLSASPERFLHVNPMTRIVHTRPIKGTRPRSADPVEDQQLGWELRNSPKDRAEHVMIVDLERNDLGRVAEIGSVQVAEMMALEGYAQVYHLTSTICAQLRNDVDVERLLRATFPGGSITGAPKVRAMQIIEELEPVAREVYTGAIGYISFHGGLDLNIAIRTAVLRDEHLTVYAGGAIVADSEPEAEYEEIRAKLSGWLLTLTSGKQSHAMDLVQR
jgi:para-aminobenzoate synthetase component 1